MENHKVKRLENEYQRTYIGSERYNLVFRRMNFTIIFLKGKIYLGRNIWA